MKIIPCHAADRKRYFNWGAAYSAICVWDFVCVFMSVGKMKNELVGETREAKDSLNGWWSILLHDA